MTEAAAISATSALHRRASWLTLLGLMVALRPLVDLLGEYEGETINAGGILGFLAVGWLLAVWTLRGAPLPRTWLPVVFFLGAHLAIHGIVSLTTAAAGSAASFGRAVVGLTPLMLLPLLHREMRGDIARTKSVVVVLSLATAVPVAIAMLQLLGVVGYSYFDWVGGEWVGRPTGGYHQPNSLARLLVFVGFFWLALATGRVITVRKAYIAAAASLAGIALTTHRTSLICASLVFGVGVWATEPFRARRGRLAVASVTLALLMLGYGLTSLASDQAGTGQAVEVREIAAVVATGWESLGDVHSDRFLRGRGYLWTASLDIHRESTLSEQLFGLGYEPIEAHNDPLRSLLVSGWVGGAALWLGLALTVIQVRRSLAQQGRTLLLALVLYIAIFAIPLQPTSYPFFMWLWTMGLLLLLALFPAVTNSPSRPPRTGSKANESVDSV